MKYICMEDIENLAAQGKKELVLDASTVLMDLARDLAHQLGIVIVDAAHPAAAQPAAPAAAKAAPQLTPASSARDVTPSLGAKPRGCQHGPLKVAVRSEQPKSQPNAGGVVDQLVELVRQSTGKRSGS